LTGSPFIIAKRCFSCAIQKKFANDEGRINFYAYLCARNKAIVGLSVLDARESGASPELFLQL
jgi:hypothetical protein